MFPIKWQFMGIRASTPFSDTPTLWLLNVAMENHNVSERYI
jgi:hypothetical protein